MSKQGFSPSEYHAILRSDFASFVERAFGELNPGSLFIPGTYIKLVASRLEDVRLGKSRRLILNLPPRTLKSHAASVALPAWLLGHDPTLQIICASYGQDLAEKHARDCRTLMECQLYRQLFPRTKISAAKHSVSDFLTTSNGGRKATSVGGPITGRGADVIIIDDVLKPEDALSDPRRRAANDWFFGTLISRLNNKEQSAIVIVMQRLHQDDLVGNVLDRGPWTVLSLPAIAMDDEQYSYGGWRGEGTFRRNAGEALHPERDTVETYKEIKRTVGEFTFNAQYQQDPTALDGGVVKKEWLRYYDPSQQLGEHTWLLQSWDTACKIGEANDYSVCTTWMVIGDRFYLIDVFRERLSYPDLKRAAMSLFNKHHPMSIVIEDHGSGTSLIQELRSEYIGCIEECRPGPGSDKSTRFVAQSTKFEAGKVYLPTGAPWLDNYVREITGFPGARHDDQVDSTSQALERLSGLAHAADRSFRMFSNVRESC